MKSPWQDPAPEHPVREPTVSLVACRMRWIDWLWCAAAGNEEAAAMGGDVGGVVSTAVGVDVGAAVGGAVGGAVGAAVGGAVGDAVGAAVAAPLQAASASAAIAKHSTTRCARYIRIGWKAVIMRLLAGGTDQSCGGQAIPRPAAWT
jgi:hypothetical protein